jgi:hypothetical protein
METKKATYYTDKLHRQLVRKAKREKWQVIRYHTREGVRTGWLVHDTGKVMQVRLVGDCRNRRVSQRERAYIETV